MVGFPNNHGVFLLKMIILWCEMGVPPFKETPIHSRIILLINPSMDKAAGLDIVFARLGTVKILDGKRLKWWRVR